MKITERHEVRKAVEVELEGLTCVCRHLELCPVTGNPRWQASITRSEGTLPMLCGIGETPEAAVRQAIENGRREAATLTEMADLAHMAVNEGGDA